MFTYPSLKEFEEYIRKTAASMGMSPDLAAAKAVKAQALQNAAMGQTDPNAPIDIRPPATSGPEQIDVEEEIRKLREDAETRKREMTVPFGTRMQALGSTLMALGNPRRDDQSAQIMAQGRQQAVDNYALELENQQREQAMRYAMKTGNPDLIAAIRGGMDPKEVIKFNMQEKMAAQKQEWDQQNALNTQMYQYMFDPTRIRNEQERADQQAFFQNMFGEQGGGSGPSVPAGDIPAAGGAGGLNQEQAVPIPEPMDTSLFSPQEQPLPQVDEFTQTVRLRTGINDLTREDAQDAMSAAQGGQKSYLDWKKDYLTRRLDYLKLNKPEGYAPNTEIRNPMNPTELLVRTAPAPVEEPSDIRTARIIREDPGLGEIINNLKKSGSGAALPEDVLYVEAGKKMVGEVFPQLAQRGNDIAASETQFQTMKTLLETAPQGTLNPDALISSFIPGWSGQNDTLRSIVYNMAPRERVEGSGSTSDLEYEGMLKSFPQILGTKEGNKAIASIIEAKRNVERDRATVVEEYQAGEISYAKAIKEIGKINKRSLTAGLPDEVKALIKAETPPEAGKSSPMSSVAKDAGMTQQQWDSLTPEQRKDIED